MGPSPQTPLTFFVLTQSKVSKEKSRLLNILDKYTFQSFPASRAVSLACCSSAVRPTNFQWYLLPKIFKCRPTFRLFAKLKFINNVTLVHHETIQSYLNFYLFHLLDSPTTPLKHSVHQRLKRFMILK